MPQRPHSPHSLLSSIIRENCNVGKLFPPSCAALLYLHDLEQPAGRRLCATTDRTSQRTPGVACDHLVLSLSLALDTNPPQTPVSLTIIYSRFATCAYLIVTAKTSTGSHAHAQLWSLFGRQLNTELRPDTEALHQVREKGCLR